MLREAFAGAPQAWLPVPEADPRHAERLASALRAGEPVDSVDGPTAPAGGEAAFVLATSGSTGTPKGALLSPAALRASVEATHARLGGPGHWLLALPAWHIAGLMVLLRAVLAETAPSVLDVSGGFDPARLPAVVEAMGSGRKYTSLVANQLIKALAQPAAREALTEFDAVLVGGGRLAPEARAEAEDAGVAVVTTYGMSETCGGCVYNRVPLDGVRVELDAEQRIHLSGPMLASGYRGMPAHPAFARPGWFATSDAGRFDGGLLAVLGRLDGGICTGGLTVAPEVVAEALLQHPQVRDCAVIGVPDARLGERVAAAVVPSGAHGPTLAELREHVAALVSSHAAPRELKVVAAIPRTGLGKVDHQALRRLFP